MIKRFLESIQPLMLEAFEHGLDMEIDIRRIGIREDVGMRWFSGYIKTENAKFDDNPDYLPFAFYPYNSPEKLEKQLNLIKNFIVTH